MITTDRILSATSAQEAEVAQLARELTGTAVGAMTLNAYGAQRIAERVVLDGLPLATATLAIAGASLIDVGLLKLGYGGHTAQEVIDVIQPVMPEGTVVRVHAEERGVCLPCAGAEKICPVCNEPALLYYPWMTRLWIKV